MFILGAMSLLDRTKALAATTTLTQTAIAAEVGVTTRWYQKVLKGEIPEPSVVKIECLHDLLAANQPTPRKRSAA